MSEPKLTGCTEFERMLNFPIAIIAATANRVVQGTRRFHSLAHLIAPHVPGLSLSFVIHRHFPYSDQLAIALAELLDRGILDVKQAAIGPHGEQDTLYTLAPPTATSSIILPQSCSTIVRLLDCSSTIVLEVASTLAFFLARGNQWDQAVSQAMYLKPVKAIPPIISQAKTLLQFFP
ncbi:MAG: hypothetical protein D6690_14600 [Nitrospirae bacterium]|nr:MAG: hypothetical protein D6690_14600 [Nitrospirota bacterium]